MSAKKKDTKPAAKKVAKPAKAAGTFNILDTPLSFHDTVKKTMEATLGKRKGREAGFSTQSELMLERLPLRSIYFQWAINHRGLAKGVTNILAPDRLGKTSLLYNLFGGFMLGGHPVGVIVCEGKPIETSWARRCMSNVPAIATKMVERVHVIESHVLAEMAEKVEEWCMALRNPESPAFVPMSTSIIMACDPMGRLATDAQAAGISEFAGLDKKKAVDVGDKGHSWDRARWLHEWVDKLLVLQARFNLHLIPVEHLNEANVAGGAPTPSFIPQYTKDLSHRTKRGGQAINQISNLQLTLANKGNIFSAGEKVARRIVMTAYKNSYGTEGRLCAFALKGEEEPETDSFLDMGLRWDYTEVEWLAENGYLGFRKTGATMPQERFSSDVLKFTQLSLTDAAQAWREADPSHVEELGSKLRIPGYMDVHGKVIEELSKEEIEHEAKKKSSKAPMAPPPPADVNYQEEAPEE